MTRPAVFYAVALLALLFNLFSLYDLVMTSIDPVNHLSGNRSEFVEMIIDWPEWRRLLWTTTVFVGVIGAVMLVLRRTLAERALWAAAGFLALGLVLDYVMLDGARGYGPAGGLFNAVIVAIEAGFALYASRARRLGMLH